MADLNVNALLRGLEYICSRQDLVKQQMSVVVSFHDRFPAAAPDEHHFVIGIYPADWHVLVMHDNVGNKYGLIRFGSSTNLAEVMALGIEPNYHHQYTVAEELCMAALHYMVAFETMGNLRRACQDASMDNSL